MKVAEGFWSILGTGIIYSPAQIIQSKMRGHGQTDGWIGTISPQFMCFHHNTSAMDPIEDR